MADHLLFTSMDAQLRFAIAHARLLRVRYKQWTRLVEPHDYGVKQGVERLLVYQLSAEGRGSDDAQGWRLLDVPKLEHVEVLAQTFPGSRASASQRHADWEAVYTRVDEDSGG